MTEPIRDSREFRVLILAPTKKDAEITESILSKVEIETLICPDVEALLTEAAEPIGCVLIAEEAITVSARRALADILARQASWSDLPLLVLTRPGADSATVAGALADLGSVSLLERPLRVATLLSAVKVALRGRERQYQLRDRFQAQALLAAIVESSDDAIISKTLQGTILTWNAGAERLFGYSSVEAIGQPITLLVPPELLEEERGILNRLVNGDRINHFETIRVTKDGRRLDVSLTISPIRDARNEIIGASKVARDISVQKRTERALRDANRRKDEFLATLAHELRNPLAPIRNSLQILQLSKPLDPGIDRLREVMDRQVNHMVRLVDDLMELSRITRGKIELRREQIDLYKIIRSAIETSQPLIDTAGHQLEVSVPSEPLILFADPVRLAQVFSNLLNNAAKYAEGAGRIWLKARRDGREVVISVRDNGIGIPAESLPWVFEMFAQIDVSNRHSQGGLGIGLTLVRSLIEMHKGTVTAASGGGPGQGSEFIVRLPLVNEPAAKLIEPKKDFSDIGLHRVLVVDDNADAADSLGMLLSHLGLTIRVAHDGHKALQALDEFHAEIVLLDIGMPGMDGYEVAQRIRERPELRDVVLIALTGWGQEEDRRRTQEAGFDYHLVKPTDISALKALLKAIADQRDANRANA